MAKLLFKTAPTPFKKGGRACFAPHVLHNGVVREETFFSRVSQKTGLAPFMIKAICDAFAAQLIEEARQGRRVETSYMSVYLTMQGSFESKSAEGRRAANARLVVNINAKGALKNCCSSDDFILENITRGATVVVRGVSAVGTDADDMLPCGVNVEVHAVGTGLYIPDTEDPSSGVWLEDMDGVICATAHVEESTAATLVCRFDEIALEDGTYRFCVASRGGLDPERYGISIARRNVQVKSTASGEVANG